MAGFTLGRADIVRRAMSKKKQKIMDKEFDIFLHGLHDEETNIEGALARGIPESTCREVLNDMSDFSKYAFNKSHAASYAVVSYQTAYLITYYPVEFFAAYLSSFIGDNANLKKKCFEVKKDAGITILSPDVNASETSFIARDDKIVFGLGALSGVGPATTDLIVEERNKNGLFENLFDFIDRMDKVADKKALEALIKSGSMDSISESHNRNELLAAYPLFQQYVQNEKNSAMAGQYSLFDYLGEDAKKTTIPKIPTLPDLDSDVKLKYEKEIAYMYLTQHPLENYRKWISNIKLDEVSDIINSIEENDDIYQSGQNVVLPIIVSGSINKKTTKKGTNVWFFAVSDEGSEISAVGFDTFVNQYGHLLNEEKCYILKGKLDQRDEETWQIIANEIVLFPQNNEEIDNFLKVVKPVERKPQAYHQSQKNIENKTPQSEVYNHGVHMKVSTMAYAESEIYPLLESIPGSYPVFLYFAEERTPDGKVVAGRYPHSINIDSPTLREIVNKVGMSNVKWF